MAIQQYGNRTSKETTPATEAVAPVAGASAGRYSWPSGQYKVIIFNHQEAAGYVYVKWNGQTCSKTGSGWDACVAPGAELVSPDGIIVTHVAIWLDLPMVYGTDHVINGWD